MFGYDFATDSTGANLGFDTINGFSVASDMFDLTGLADRGFDGVIFLGTFENESTANTAISTSNTAALEVVFVAYTAGDHEGYLMPTATARVSSTPPTSPSR